jgi:hypothetical protein
VNWKERGVRLKQATNFPESERAELAIEKTPAKAWTLRLRIPAWTTAENSVAINGKRLEASGTPGSYLTLTRVWKAGDRVELTMPMRLTAEPLADDRTQQAFLYGPLVLAGQFPKTGLAEDLEHIRDRRFRRRPRWSASSESGRRRSGYVDQAGPGRGACVPHCWSGAAHPEAVEPKLATVRRVLDGVVTWDSPDPR